MSGERPTLTVSKIRMGTVIDHIPAGRALAVLRVLRISGAEGLRVAILMNVESRKLGRKDIVKIEGKVLSADEVNAIALIAPQATINIVEDFKVVKKFRVEIPDTVIGVLKCPNPTCISNKEREPIVPRFRALSKNPPALQCVYCGTIVGPDEIVRLVLDHVASSS